MWYQDKPYIPSHVYQILKQTVEFMVFAKILAEKEPKMKNLCKLLQTRSLVMAKVIFFIFDV